MTHTKEEIEAFWTMRGYPTLVSADGRTITAGLYPWDPDEGWHDVRTDLAHSQLGYECRDEEWRVKPPGKVQDRET